MGYITVDVDIDYDDLEVDDLIDALEDKMDKAVGCSDPMNTSPNQLPGRIPYF